MATNTIPILEKTVAVLEALARAEGGLSAKNLSLTLRIPPASCYRILRTLGKHNWIREEGDGQYRLAYGLATLTRGYTATEQRLRLLEYPLRQLTEDTGLSAKICLREGEHAVTVLRSESRRLNAIASPVGSRIHLVQAGAAGTVLLSLMPPDEARSVLIDAPKECWAGYTEKAFWQDVQQARTRKISRALGKFHPSIYALAVPIWITPEIRGALAIVGWPDDFQGKAQQALLEKKLLWHVARMPK